jgi:spore coat protein JB
MNNYPNFKNFDYKDLFNQITNLPNNTKDNLLYEPYEGFIKGNMYKDLYDPYKIRQPYEIRPMNEQAELLTRIDALCFACIDLSLYLDVYPDDRNILTLFNQYREEKKQLESMYERKYGPLLLSSDSLNTYPWAWNNKPWPWEN